MRSLFKANMFDKHFRKLKEKVRKHDSGGINSLSSITLLAESPAHSASELDAATRHFRKMGIDCVGYLVCTDKDLSTVSDILHYIQKQDVSWYGVPKQETLISWLSHKTDLLIMLNPNNTPLLNYLCVASNSRLKSALDYGHGHGNDVDFYLQCKELETLNAKELCYQVYEELKKISEPTLT